MRSQPRDVYDIRVEGRNIDGDGNEDGHATNGGFQESESFDTRLLICISSEDIEYSTCYPRADIEPEMVNIPLVTKKEKRKVLYSGITKLFHFLVTFWVLFALLLCY